MHLVAEFGSLLWIVLAAACSPVLARLSRGWVPDTVWLLALGLIIGPGVLGLAESAPSIAFVAELGLGLLFLLAGVELDPATLRSRQGAGSAIVWVISTALAIGLVALLLGLGSDPITWVAIGLALTSTALGTLLPILSNAGVLRGPVGSAVLVHGAVGEIGPVVAMALLLSGRGLSTSVVVLLAFAVLTVVLVIVPSRALQRIPGIKTTIIEGAAGTSQTVLRVIFLILVTLMFLSVWLHLDVVLGAFTAGMLVRAATPPKVRTDLEHSLQGVGFAIFIPVFFVTSGMGISLAAVLDAPLTLVAFVLAILLLRGGPIVLGQRLFGLAPKITTLRASFSLGLYAATGLPIIVAVTTIASDADILSEADASLLVAAGACTVLIFPALARLVTGRRQPETER